MELAVLTNHKDIHVRVDDHDISRSLVPYHHEQTARALYHDTNSELLGPDVKINDYDEPFETEKPYYAGNDTFLVVVDYPHNEPHACLVLRFNWDPRFGRWALSPHIVLVKAPRFVITHDILPTLLGLTKD